MHYCVTTSHWTIMVLGHSTLNTSFDNRLKLQIDCVDVCRIVWSVHSFKLSRYFFAETNKMKSPMERNRSKGVQQ